MRGKLLFAGLLVVACRPSEPRPIEGPPLALTPIKAEEADAAAPKAERVAPVVASFLELSGRTPRAIDTCDVYAVALVRGAATALGEKLEPGDAVVATGKGDFELDGSGVLVVAEWKTQGCTSGAARMTKKTIRASAAPELTWAGGKMHAHLDVGTDVSPNLYIGRLEGTAPVAEHVHEGSWEIIAAIEASGTFTLDGKEQRLGPRSVVYVPPNTKHSWKPDEGSKLVAIQMYSPPGPEQRFKALAAAAADAGTPKR
jgi:mannose-6-phosphate isomerase-like protein (cupin superfamily)